MPIEEQVSDRIMQAGISSARLSLQVSKTLARMLIQEGGWATQATVGNLIGLIQNRHDSGRVSEKKLQRIADGDIHEIKLDPQSIRAVSKSLHQAGITYAVEKRDDDRHYLHFRGRDMDHIQHSVERAFEKLGFTFDPEELAPIKVEGHNASSQAVHSASSLIPENVPEDAPEFTMRFQTVEWDPSAEIIRQNFMEMGIPFHQTDGEDGHQSFTFPAPYAAPVKEFIDVYSENVKYFETDRVTNYDELCTVAGSKDIGHIQSSTQQKRTAHGSYHKPQHLKQEKNALKNRADFLAQLNKRTEQNLSQSHQAPVKTVTRKPIR